MSETLDMARLSNDVYRTFVEYDFFEHLLREVGPNHANGRDVLEAGCGSGKMSIGLAMRAPLRCVGLDVSQEAVDYARRLALVVEMGIERRLPVAFMRGDFVRQPLFTRGQFHFVFSEGVPEHFGHDDTLRQAYFDLCAKVASRKVIVFVPNLDCPEQQEISEKTHHHYEGCTDVEEDFDRAELAERLGAAGLKSVRVVPVTSGPWEKSRFILGVGRVDD